MEKTKAKEKIQNIEFLRLVFIIFIVWGHLMFLPSGLFDTFKDIEVYQHLICVGTRGWLAVDYFFIIAGFLLVYNFKNITVVEFIKKKIIRLWPSLLGLYLILSLLHLCIPNINLDIYQAIISLTFLGNTGIYINGYAWFISPLFISLLLYFYLMKTYKNENVNLTIAVVTFSSYILITTSQNWHDAYYQYLSVFNIGLLRGLGGVGIGYLIGQYYHANIRNKDTSQNFIEKIYYTIIEIFLLFYIIYYSLLHSMRHSLIIFMLAFIMLFWCFINKKGYIAKLLDNKLSSTLGKYVYSIYIFDIANTAIWFNILPNFSNFAHLHPILLFIITFLTGIAGGWAMYHLFEKTIISYFSRRQNNGNK